MKRSPATALSKLQHFLELPVLDYSQRLVYDTRKGFYCVVDSGKKKVLRRRGRGGGVI